MKSIQVKNIPDQKLISCDESFLGKGFNLPMGQLSRSGRVILVIWPSAKASQLSIRRENGALSYFSTIERDNALLSWSSYISQRERGRANWMNAINSCPPQKSTWSTRFSNKMKLTFAGASGPWRRCSRQVSCVSSSWPRCAGPSPSWRRPRRPRSHCGSDPPWETDSQRPTMYRKH